jgi:hypothetical protein
MQRKALSAKETIEYMHQNFTKVDGLWFVKVEERFGFDTALETDEEVWQVIPKMQARFLKKKLALEDGFLSFAVCIKNKLRLDNFDFTATKRKGSLKIVIARCPWHQTMIKSGRKELSKKIGSTICPAEYTAFANEFGAKIDFKIACRICTGDASCTMLFQERKPPKQSS